MSQPDPTVVISGHTYALVPGVPKPEPFPEPFPELTITDHDGDTAKFKQAVAGERGALMKVGGGLCYLNLLALRELDQWTTEAIAWLEGRTS